MAEKLSEWIIKALISEAAGEGPEGMRKVAETIRNRANERGLTPEQVVRQPAQYTGVTNPGPGIDFNNQALRAIAEQAWEKSATPADPTGGATQYWAPKGMPGGRDPYWADEEQTQYGRLVDGGHVFLPKRTPTYDDMQAPNPRARMSDQDRLINASFGALPQRGLSAADSLAADPVVPSSIPTQFDAGLGMGANGGMAMGLFPGGPLNTGGMTGGPNTPTMRLPQYPVPANPRTSDPAGQGATFGQIAGLPGAPRPADQSATMQAFRDANSPFPRARSESPNAMADVMATFERFGNNGMGQQIGLPPSGPPQMTASDRARAFGSMPVPTRLAAGEANPPSLYGGVDMSRMGGIEVNPDGSPVQNGLPPIGIGGLIPPNPMPRDAGIAARTRPLTGMGGVDIDPSSILPPVEQRGYMPQSEVQRLTAGPQAAVAQRVSQMQGAPTATPSRGGGLAELLSGLFGGGKTPGGPPRDIGFNPSAQYDIANSGFFRGGMQGLPPGMQMAPNGFIYEKTPQGWKRRGNAGQSRWSGHNTNSDGTPLSISD